MIGERQNVTGSARFRRLIESGDYQAAVEIAADQVRSGANMLDVNMDADLLDGVKAMTTFLNLIATEPEIARVPVMVDSSKWDVLEAGLKCLQGKGIVNSISLKEGEEDFLEKARRVKRYGAAVVVMAFDEQGQADTVERKLQILERSVGLLIDRAGYVARGHRRRPVHPGDRDRDRGAQRVRHGVHRGHAAAQGAAAGRQGLRRRLEPLVQLPRERRRARGDPLGVPVPRDRRRPRHGDRERGTDRALRGHPAGPARARRGHHLRPPARRDRAHGRVRRDRQGRRHEEGARPLVARDHRRGAPQARARARDRRVHRAGHRGGTTRPANGRWT